jgi:Tfp pilus assembly protein FimT
MPGRSRSNSACPRRSSPYCLGPSTVRSFSSPGGFSTVELLVAVVLVGSLVTFAGSFVGTEVRRGRLTGTVREVRSILWDARVSAIRSGHPVVVQFDAAAREITVFRDYSSNPVLPHTGAIAANDCNGVQDTYTDPSENEPTLRTYRLPEGLVFRRPGGAVADSDSVAFDGTVPKPLAPPVADRIIFLNTGRALFPTSANSRRPVALPGGIFDCADSRGAYVSDPVGRDFFRISVDDAGIGGKVSLLKYLGSVPEDSSERYGPQPWSWSR